MKISEYINKLNEYKLQFGDIEVVEAFEDPEFPQYHYISAEPWYGEWETEDGVGIKDCDRQMKKGDIVIIQGFKI